jgi:CDP-diacylglycerol--serine O-phosphatidyltransferase
LIGYPWHILSIGSVLYLLSLPLGWKSYRDLERAAASRAAASAEPPYPQGPQPFTPAPVPAEAEPDSRPPRLN